jgi:glycosyltransferase involved in cell wall biosynthesis
MLPLLINMSLELGISQNVRFLGYVPEEDQERIYKIADVYVMPSTSEPFGITALEAMSSGVPVIVSRTSGVAEIAKSTIKVDFWDINAMAQKIIAVLKYRPLSTAMSRMSSEESKIFSWDRTAEDTLKVYEEALRLKK